MATEPPDLTLCDREPIHIPGSIQPHGVLLVVDRNDLTVGYGAGPMETMIGLAGPDGQPIDTIFRETATAGIRETARTGRPLLLYGVPAGAGGRYFDLSVHAAGDWLLVELEPASETPDGSLLSLIEAAAAAFEAAPDPATLFDVAAREFQRLSQYDRVMIYRFLDDDSGMVVGERTTAGMESFLNHRFPASDIPRQARALYVRNLVRVIPDVRYVPAPIRPAWREPSPLDLSDSILRSVSPIHIAYLRNMGVDASASISIVRDGALWGLVACHSRAPRSISSERRTACRALAAGLARQIRAREDTDVYRERVRLRTFEDDIVAILSREGSRDRAISNHVDEIRRMLDADGLAVLRGDDLVLGGACPPEEAIRKIAGWVMPRAAESVYATDALGEHYPDCLGHSATAAGLLAITLSMAEPWLVIWFRAEHLQVVNWAGNPHDKETGPDGMLTPRASFAAWSETVEGRSRRWTLPEVEAAGRLRTAVMAVWQNRRIRDLNRQLMATLDEKDMLIRQNGFLMREVNHRVQNSLQLVSSFLSLQMRASEDEGVQSAMEEARRRISAVSLVHRRLYLADQIDAIDAARYFEELLTDLVASLGEEWKEHFAMDLEPVMLPTDRAVALGLVLTELVINANKYAYGGAAGPLSVRLAGDGNRVRLSVADKGGGKTSKRFGFGSRMIEALVARVDGEVGFEDNRPGLRAVVTAPIEVARGGERDEG